MQSFSDLAIPASIKNALEKMKFVTPTEVQAATLPLAMEGSDIIACASTGSGKTGAFAIPAITMLINNPDKNALVLAPTRELAQQISEFMRQITDYCEGITMVSIVGGFDMQRQLNALRRKPRIIIATPGRLTDHLRRRSISLSNTGILILDEGDRMLDMGFAPQLDAILQFLPQKRQTMLFTATLPPKVKELCRQYLHKPKEVSVGRTSQPVETVAQYAMTVPQEKKNETLLEELNKREGSIIVFARTQRRTDALAEYLDDYGVPVTVIHGGLTQGRRNRAIQGFKRGEYRVLVATDIAARGIDVPAVEHVINFDLPLMDEDYVHRVGRTARNGAKGEALSFVSHHEYGLWAVISRKYNVHSDAVIDPRKNKKGKKGSARADRAPAPQRARAKDNSFFTTEELPAIEMIPEGDISPVATSEEILSVREVAEQRRAESRKPKFEKGFQKSADAFDPEDRVIEKALAEENLALDMQDGVKIERDVDAGFDPAERYGKRKSFGGDRKDRFGKKRPFDRENKFVDEFGEERYRRGSKPFIEKFFNGEDSESTGEESSERRFDSPRGRFSKPDGGHRRFDKPRSGFKKFGGNRDFGGERRERPEGRGSFGKRDGFGGRSSFGKRDGFEDRGSFKKRDGFEGRGSFERRDKFAGNGSFERRNKLDGGGSFERRNKFDGGSSFERRNKFDGGSSFERRNKFDGGSSYPRRDGIEGREKKSFSSRGENGFEKRGSFKPRSESGSSDGGYDRPKKKNNWFSRDKDRRADNSKRNSGARY